MAGTVAVITSLYGDYDSPVPPPLGFDEAVMVTDREQPVEGWQQIVLPQPGRHPRLAAKLAKFRPDLFTGCESSLWVDSNMRFEGGRGLRQATETHLATNDMVAWRHPEARTCIKAEADYCHHWGKYVDYPLVRQAETYLSEGMPADFGLYCCNLIGRRHTPAIRQFGLEWLAENEKWSIQDQISFPYLVWRTNLTVSTWQADYASNPWVRWAPHNRND